MNTNNGFCECGCGEPAPVATRTDSNFGWIKGKPKRFILGHSVRNKRGPQNHNWKGGRQKTVNGYILTWMPEHPRSNKAGYVFEHILVMERVLGRPIKVTEPVHHINENRADNSPGNLMLFLAIAMHSNYHRRLDAFKSCGHWDWKKCCYCQKYDDPKNLKHNHHRECQQKRSREYYVNQINNPVHAG